MKNKIEKTKNQLFNKKQFDPNYQPSKGNTNRLPSMCIPDMSLGIKQLLQNHTRGIHSDIHVNQPQFFDTEIPNFHDITDREHYREQLNIAKTNLEQQIATEHKQKLLDVENQKKASLIAAEQLNLQTTPTQPTDPSQNPK